MGLLDSFLNLLRPSHKHSDPAKRADAVRQLDSGDDKALAEVARHDPDAQIRRIALKKIDDAVLLAELAKSDPDEGIRRAAGEKADEILIAAATGADEQAAQAALSRIGAQRTLAEVAKKAPLPSIRRAALSRLSDERALTDVAKNAEDVATRLGAVGKIDDTAVLRDVAIRDAAKEVGLAAIEKIAETAVLEEVVKRAKNKQVREAARERLPQAMGKVQLVESRPAEASPAARRQARRMQLCREAEQAAAIEDLDQSEAALATLRAEWRGIERDPGDEDSHKRFDRAFARIDQRKRAHEETLRRQHEEEEERRRKAEAEEKDTAARLALIQKVEALDGEGLRARVEAIREEWQALGRAARGDLFQQFKKACDTVIKRAELAISKQKLRERMEAVAAEADTVGLPGSAPKDAEGKLRLVQKKWRELEAAGGDDALKARVTAAEARVNALKAAEQEKRAAEETAVAARLEELCAKIEALADTSDRKAAEQELKVAASAFETEKGRGPKITAARERFAKARDRVAARLAEMREAEHWKRWANVPKLEKLCERMEALKDQADPKEAAAQLKAMQAEWKTVGPAPKEKSEALWQRFKTAADEVFKKTHEGFEKLDAERGENLKKKEELVARAEAIVAAFEAQSAPAAAAPVEGAAPTEPAAPAHGAWKETADKLKALQEEWKQSGPAPKEQGDAVWKKFRAACDRFFSKRKEHIGAEKSEREANLKALEALIARAEAIAAQVENQEGRPGVVIRWKELADEVKGLQAEWKGVGHAGREAQENAWKRFRDACDRFFEKRKSSFDKLDGERGDNLKKKEALCEKAEALAAQAAEGGDRDGAMKEAKALQAEWKKVGQAPKEQADAIWRRFRAACDKIFDRGRKDEGAEMPELTAEEKAAIAAYGKFENKLPLQGVLAQLKPEDKKPADSAGDEPDDKKSLPSA